MKKVIKLLLSALFTTFMMTLQGCKKEPVYTPEIPTLTTYSIPAITAYTADVWAYVHSDGGAEVTVRGVCWSTTRNPEISDNKTTEGAGSGPFSSRLTGLTANTTYFARAYATNMEGTAYGYEIPFTTRPEVISDESILFVPDLIYGSVSDFDGNVYKTILIGEQTWMAENLRTTRFNDGKYIPVVTLNESWSMPDDSPACCWYNNDVKNKIVYGALYNWFTVADGDLCPVGWHIPSDTDLAELQTFLGGEDVAGGRMRETGTTHWMVPNIGGSNTSGWTALPGGRRSETGDFLEGGSSGYWWTTRGLTDSISIAGKLTHDKISVSMDELSDRNGLSLRCIKD